jgi:hypothetical protein
MIIINTFDIHVCKNMKHIDSRSWRNRTSRFLSTGYLESDGRCGGGLCHYFVFLCHAYVSWVALITQSSSTSLSDKKCNAFQNGFIFIITQAAEKN